MNLTGKVVKVQGIDVSTTKITQYGIESLDKKVDEWNFVKNIMDKFLDGEMVMEVINNYIDSLYKNDNSQEVLELKEELKEYLIMSANEFINEGYEEQDAW